MTTKFIDIEQLFKAKAPFWFSILPGRVMRYIKQKIHEDEINATINELQSYKGLDFNGKVLARLKIETQHFGLESLPQTGPVTIVANHPLGGLDGMALLHAVSKIRPDVQVFVNDLLTSIHNFGNVFVPVNSFGRSSVKHVREMEQAFKQNGVVILFPAGMVSRASRSGIRDLNWKKSCITQSIKYKRTIVPVFINGNNSKAFYSLALWRKRLGIKLNLEMFLLPDEMFKSANRHISLCFGFGIAPNYWSNDIKPEIWVVYLNHYVYSDAIRNGITFDAFLKTFNRADSNQ
jgi:putative hemolysin